MSTYSYRPFLALNHILHIFAPTSASATTSTCTTQARATCQHTTANGFCERAEPTRKQRQQVLLPAEGVVPAVGVSFGFQFSCLLGALRVLPSYMLALSRMFDSGRRLAFSPSPLPHSAVGWARKRVKASNRQSGVCIAACVYALIHTYSTSRCQHSYTPCFTCKKPTNSEKKKRHSEFHLHQLTTP